MSTVARRGGRLDAILDRLELPPGAIAYALRIWLAMMTALFAGFWLELSSASSAAVTVAILAQPRRGQALSKAFYRFLGTIVGFGVSIVLAGLFGQDRVLMLIAFSVWLGLCVFTANYLQGTRAYGAMLSGYTVAIIAIANIDAPQTVFSVGIERVAAIALGIVSITFINDALGAPSAYTALRAGLGKARRATQAFVRRTLDEGPLRPDETAVLVKQITDARQDIPSIAGEFTDGVDRAAGARSLAAALFAEVAAARGFATAATLDQVPGEADALRARIREGLSRDPAALADLEARAEAAVADPASTPERVLLHRRAADILRHEQWAESGERALGGGGPPGRTISLPLHRDFPDALRAAIRVIVAFGISAALFIATGWPETSSALLIIAAMGAISSITPSPLAFAKGVLIAMPITVVLGGIVKFLVLAGGDQGFPLLALAMAPVIVAGSLISLRPQTYTVGFIMIVFFPTLLGVSNPQTFDPQAFLDTGVLFMTAALLLFLSLRLVLPTSVTQRRLWSLRSARADILEAIAGRPKAAWQRVNLDSDRLAQYVTRRRPRADGGFDRTGFRHALTLARLDTSAAGAQAALHELSAETAFRHAVPDARNALAALDRPALRRAAEDLIAAAVDAPASFRRAASFAVADLAIIAEVVAHERRILKRFDLVRAW